MARDDWRIRIEVTGEGHAHGFLEQLRAGLGGEALELARELGRRRLAVSRDGDEVFVYAGSRNEAERARAVVESELRAQQIEAEIGAVESWLAAEERWSAEPGDETWEEDELDRGFAPWEVRVECDSHAAAERLADELEGEGFGVVRRWRYLIAGTETREDAEALASRLHGEAEPGGEGVWESVPGNPFAIFGGLGGSGTPV